uniref:Uncharacterized protein n=1 Tax=Arion vulgaris TaxID=1028688 RepID=A0A0B7BAG9_9EUPU
MKDLFSRSMSQQDIKWSLQCKGLTSVHHMSPNVLVTLRIHDTPSDKCIAQTLLL